MKWTNLVALLLAVTTLSVLAAPPGQDGSSPRKKEPWEWTDSERIAARFSPEFIKANSHPPASSPAGFIAAEGIPTDLNFVIDGSKNPEMFMPFELFAHLLQGVQGTRESRDTIRAMFREKEIAFGFRNPDTFWNELETVVHAHLTMLQDMNALDLRLSRADRKERDGIQAEIDKLRVSICGSSAQSLEAARAHFGRETFDRFLYTVVASGLTRTGRVPSSDTASEYVYTSGGCR